EDKKGFHFASTYKLNPKLSVRGEFEYLQVNRAITNYQFKDTVSAWDGKTYESGLPLTGTGAPSAAQLAIWGVARTPQRVVSHPSFGNEYLTFTNRFRTIGMAQNNTAPNYYLGKPIVTVGWTLRGQAMRDGNDGVPEG